MNTKTQLFLDRISIGISTLCAVHCAVMPLLLVLSPNLLLAKVDDHLFHIFLVWLIIPISSLAAFLGCNKHKNKKVLAGIILGLTGLIFSAQWGHDVLGEAGEIALTLTSTTLLGLAHLLNFKLCKESSCNDCC